MTNQKEAKAGANSPQQQQRLAVGVKTAAQMLDVSPSKCWDMLRRAEIPRVRMGGRTVVRISDLESLLSRAVMTEG